MEKKLGVPRYLFFSDDLSWVKRQFGNKDNNYYIEDYGKFEDYQELMIMSRCRNFIIANSTFSWWAAWLCSYENKVVIMPRVWTYVGGQEWRCQTFRQIGLEYRVWSEGCENIDHNAMSEQCENDKADD